MEIEAILNEMEEGYRRDQCWKSNDDVVIQSPNTMEVCVGAKVFEIKSMQDYDLDNTLNWDSSEGAYVIAGNRAKKDFYIYACDNHGVLDILLSADSRNPSDYTTWKSRKIGGFHCVDSDFSNYTKGDIMPLSIWDLNHRPKSSPAGMYFDKKLNLWIDLYLTPVKMPKMPDNKISASDLHWSDLVDEKRLPTQHELLMSFNQKRKSNI